MRRHSSRHSIVSALSTFVLLSSTAAALAAPMAPSNGSLQGKFSAQVQADFVLLADTEDPNLIYYVPQRGGVAVDARGHGPFKVAGTGLA
jgi:hypothetical protein